MSVSLRASITGNKSQRANSLNPKPTPRPVEEPKQPSNHDNVMFNLSRDDSGDAKRMTSEYAPKPGVVAAAKTKDSGRKKSAKSKSKKRAAGAG